MTSPTESVTSPAGRDARGSGLAFPVHLPAAHLTTPQHASICWCPASHDQNILTHKQSSCMLLNRQEPKMGFM